MADNAVQPRVDHCLILLNAHGAAEIGVFAEHLGVEDIGDKEQSRADDADRHRKHIPIKPHAESRNDKAAKEHKSAELDHYALLSSLFLCVKARSKQTRIFYHHNDTRAEHRNKKDSHKYPSLDIVKSPRGQKYQKSDEKNAQKEFCNC